MDLHVAAPRRHHHRSPRRAQGHAIQPTKVQYSVYQVIQVSCLLLRHYPLPFRTTWLISRYRNIARHRIVPTLISYLSSHPLNVTTTTIQQYGSCGRNRMDSHMVAFTRVTAKIVHVSAVRGERRKRHLIVSSSNTAHQRNCFGRRWDIITTGLLGHIPKIPNRQCPFNSSNYRKIWLVS